MTKGYEDLSIRYERLKGAEQHKNALIEELLQQLKQIQEDFEQEKLDHMRESHFNRDIQLREKSLLEELRRYKSKIDRDAFILALIDGDGMIFNDDLIKSGEEGGRQAANSLWNALSDRIENALEFPPDIKIVVRVYANIKGLGDTCHKAGILSRPSLLEDFARGFTGAKQLFDFVDVGMGKDRADDKIGEIFKMHLYNCHCRHIFFGGSHDNGYARILEDISDSAIQQSVTLLEGVPFERELAFLKSKYQTTRFDGIFRNSKINVFQQQQQQQHHQALPVPINNANKGVAPAVNYEHSYTTPSYSVPPAPANGSMNTSSPLQTWASTAMNAAHLPASPPPQPQSSQSGMTTIPRNRWGQRIDSSIAYDLSEVQRLKKMKLCNVHFLRQDCPYDNCSHSHNYKPTKNELQNLLYISRMMPCKFGTECDDPKCLFGHRCPVDEEGKNDCRWGENCRFPPEMHGMDRTPVRTMKVGGK